MHLSYGAEGYQIVLLTLELMFPNYEIDSPDLTPLSPHMFQERVMLPEAFTCLVLQDLPHLTQEQAIKTLQDSQDFGNSLHPEVDDSTIVHELIDKVAALDRKVCRIEVKIEQEESIQVPQLLLQEVSGIIDLT